MITYFVAFLCSLMVGATLTLVVRNRAYRFGWVDRVRSSRNVHQRPIPRLGGIAIVGGFCAPLIGLLVVDSSVGQMFRASPSLIAGLFVGGMAIAGLGLYDDLRGAGARLKFSVQFLVALGLYAIGFRIEALANPFGAPIELGVLALPVTLLWIVGVVNAMNLIDGLDGLAGGVAFFGIATNFVLALSRGEVLLCLTMVALGGAVLGFLVFNFNPASIFMGDTGSMFLGFVLAAVSLKTSAKSGTAVAMLVPIIALGLPIMDTLLAMIRRTVLGRPMFSADKEHIHHRLMSRLVLSHRNAVLVLYGLCCLFALTALGLSFASSAQSAMLLAGVGLVVFVLMRKLGYLNLRDAGVVSEVRRRNLELRSVVKRVTDAVRVARTLEALWEAVRPLGLQLGASQILLQLNLAISQEEGREQLMFQVDQGGSGFPVEVRVGIGHRESTMGHLQVTWRDGRTEVRRDEELALELVADTMAEALARIASRSAADPERVIALRR